MTAPCEICKSTTKEADLALVQPENGTPMQDACLDCRTKGYTQREDYLEAELPRLQAEVAGLVNRLAARGITAGLPTPEPVAVVNCGDCGRPLTPDEITYYLHTCESCEQQGMIEARAERAAGGGCLVCEHGVHPDHLMAVMKDHLPAVLAGKPAADIVATFPQADFHDRQLLTIQLLQAGFDAHQVMIDAIQALRPPGSDHTLSLVDWVKAVLEDGDYLAGVVSECFMEMTNHRISKPFTDIKHVRTLFGDYQTESQKEAIDEAVKEVMEERDELENSIDDLHKALIKIVNLPLVDRVAHAGKIAEEVLASQAVAYEKTPPPYDGRRDLSGNP